MSVTLTLPSYGRIVRDRGVPVDPEGYDYRRAALYAMHFAKLVDRWVERLRRGAGFRMLYSAAIEPEHRRAPHVHVAMRGAIPRQVIRQVIRGDALPVVVASSNDSILLAPTLQTVADRPFAIKLRWPPMAPGLYCPRSRATSPAPPAPSRLCAPHCVA